MDDTRDLVLYVTFPCTLATPAYGQGQPYVADSPAKAAYVDALAAELAALDDDIRTRPVRAVRLGGGASIMKADKVCELVRSIRTTMNLDAHAEVSIDANPLTVGTPCLTDWTSCGVNRVRLLVGSVLDTELAELGATHRREHVQNALLFLEKFNLARVDPVLLCGLPGQTRGTWKQTVQTVCELGCPHITVRPLVEPDAQKAARLPSAAERRAMYEDARALLGQKGYEEYLVGSFVNAAAPHARDAFACAQRAGAGCLALGAGARNAYDGFLYENALDFDLYVQHAADFELIMRNPRREGVAARQAREIQASLDALEAVSPREAGGRQGLAPETRAWLEAQIEAGALAPAGTPGWFKLSDVGRAARLEELGREVRL